jgi:hypothetical protein
MRCHHVNLVSSDVAGYEQRHNSEEGKRASKDYNKDIAEGTLRYAMIDLIQHPPSEFESVIKAHFR